MAKRIRGIILAIVIWAVCLIVLTFLWIFKGREPSQFTVDNSFVSSEEEIYISDNSADNGIIYKTDLKGNVIKMFVSRESAFINGYKVLLLDKVGETIYGVFSKKTVSGTKESTGYVVTLMDENLEIEYLTPVFKLPLELKVTGFAAYEDKFYITALSSNGQQAYAYMVPASCMITLTDDFDKDRKQWEETKPVVTQIGDIESVWPRFYTDAEYRDGNFIVRYDNDEPGYFEVNDAISEVYEGIAFNPLNYLRQKGFSPAIIAVVFIVGSLAIIAFFLLLANRKRIVYAIVIFEALLLILSCGVVYFIAYNARRTSEKEFVRFAVSDSKSIVDGYGMADLSSQLLYDSDVYENVSGRLKRRVTTEGSGVVITDELVVDVFTGEIVMSASGNNNTDIGKVYGDRVSEMIQCIGNGDEYIFCKNDIKGVSKAILITSLSSVGQRAYALVIVADAESLYHGLLSSYGGCIRMVLIIFVLGSIAGWVILTLQSLDIKRLQNALSALASGEEEPEKVAVIGRDMNFMWNSITEIRKNIVNTNRIKFMTYEAYFRFAPKSIERILKKQSITEIKSGDMISANGALALLLAPGRWENGRAEISVKGELLNITEECRNSYDGILISQDNDLSTFKYLFTENNRNCVGFGTELMLKLKEDRGRGFNNAFMILHYTPYFYGVAGDEKQAAVYFASNEAEKLWAFAEWFRELKLALVITEELLEREGGAGDYRYIGFVLTGSEMGSRKLKLYEALDALPAAVRSRRVRQKQKFNDALTLFYKKDFYIARGVFSEILRESPDDELSKWYLFECERYLNDTMPGDFGGELHRD